MKNFIFFFNSSGRIFPFHSWGYPSWKLVQSNQTRFFLRSVNWDCGGIVLNSNHCVANFENCLKKIIFARRQTRFSLHAVQIEMGVAGEAFEIYMLETQVQPSLIQALPSRRLFLFHCAYLASSVILFQFIFTTIVNP